MKYLKAILSLLLVVLLSTAMWACDSNQNNKSYEQKTGLKSADSAKQLLEDLKKKDDEFNSASLERKLELIRAATTPSTETLKLLNSHTAAVSGPLAHGNFISAYYTNHNGVTIYLNGHPYPFNFIWSGSTVMRKGIDGQEYQMADGTGQLLIKNMHEDYIAKLYEGSLANGLWNGPSLYITRGHSNSDDFFTRYSGDYNNGEIKGEGLLYSFGITPNEKTFMSYEGSFRNGLFHGKGILKSLTDDENVFKGIFIGGDFIKDDSPLSEENAKRLYQSIKTLDPPPALENIFIAGHFQPDYADNFDDNDNSLTIITSVENVSDFIVEYGDGQTVEAYEIIDEGIDLYSKFSGVKLDLKDSDYPVKIKISLKLRDERHFLSFIVINPVTIKLIY